MNTLIHVCICTEEHRLVVHYANSNELYNFELEVRKADVEPHSV